jgi:SLIT-ROBO Rho GTPase activating protein
MNSVAGVIKLYFRELKEPLFPRDMFDSFISCVGKQIYRTKL